MFPRSKLINRAHHVTFTIFRRKKKYFFKQKNVFKTFCIHRTLQGQDKLCFVKLIVLYMTKFFFLLLLFYAMLLVVIICKEGKLNMSSLS